MTQGRRASYTAQLESKHPVWAFGCLICVRWGVRLGVRRVQRAQRARGSRGPERESSFKKSVMQCSHQMLCNAVLDPSWPSLAG